jgi:hypothetical protein
VCYDIFGKCTVFEVWSRTLRNKEVIAKNSIFNGKIISLWKYNTWNIGFKVKTFFTYDVVDDMEHVFEGLSDPFWNKEVKVKN